MHLFGSLLMLHVFGGVVVSGCIECTYLNWHPWERCQAPSVCGRHVRKRVRELCCPTSITGPHAIDRCLQLCNITDPWKDFVNDNPGQCQCHAANLDTCCKGRLSFG